MKAVLISIRPRYCEKIASGKKTVEVRKTIPKIPTPFKCYIYETKDKRFEDIAVCWNDGTPDFIHATGKVIGEFVCDRIDTIRDVGNGFVAGGVQPSEWYFAAQTLIQAVCLTEKELKSYLGNDYGYGWHISDLKIYDKPKELGEFTTPFCPYEVAKCKVGARLCKHYTFEDALGGECDYAHRITRPPQSYMFVEELP